MAKRTALDDKLAALNRLRDDPRSPEAPGELCQTIRGRTSVLVARAAVIAREAGLRDLAGDLAAAFDRFLNEPAKNDRSCLAKRALAETLDVLEWSEAETFLRGIRHVQLEGTFGPPIDTAAVLRGLCAQALVRMGYRDALREATGLLADRWVDARLGAARAAGMAGTDAAELLLRLKIMAGDQEPAVLGECFLGLIKSWPHRSLEFVARYLSASAWEPNPGATVACEDTEAARELAAVALAESRLPEAAEILRKRYENSVDSASKKLLLLPLALTRRDEAFDFVLSRIR